MRSPFRRSELTVLVAVILDVGYCLWAIAHSFVTIGVSNIGIAMVDISETEKIYSDQSEVFNLLCLAMFFWFLTKAMLFVLIGQFLNSKTVRVAGTIYLHLTILFLVLAVVTPAIMFWESGVLRFGERLSFYFIALLVSLKVTVEALLY